MQISKSIRFSTNIQKKFQKKKFLLKKVKMKIKPLEAFIFSQTYNLSSETNKTTGEP